ncbi:hypothetical protein [Achromobacter insuavis]|uniref:hypothetical protein n=1 Tax=Achromobacter insuavis TaxID=1287735 RepID=UPI001F134D6D|nr:hypothetical protein [Achromobacter insuavis]
MRFTPFGKHEFQDTQRKRAALARKQANERAAYPLFAADIAAEQHSVDQVMADRGRLWSAQLASDRARACNSWLTARRLLRSYAQVERAALYRYWQTCRWPGTPEYLLSMLNMYDTGRLEEVYGRLGLIGPARPGEDLAGASIASPLRTAAGGAYWPAPPVHQTPLRAPARRDAPPPAQLTL